MFDTQGFEPIGEDSRNASTTLREPLRESVVEFGNSIAELRESGDEGETSMKSAIELAKEFKTSDRSIQNWYGIVASAYCWLPEADLKVGTGKHTRYTALCLAKMGELKAARDGGLTANEWIASIHDANAEKLQVCPSTQQTDQPIDVELIDEVTLQSPAPMIHVPEVQGSSRLGSALARRAEVQNRLNQTLQEFAAWDEALNKQIEDNKEAQEIEKEAGFDEKVIDLLLRKKEEQDRLKKLEALIDSGAISADELLKRYAGNVPAPTASSVSA